MPFWTAIPLFPDNNTTSTNDTSAGQKGDKPKLGSNSNQTAIVLGSIGGVLGAISIVVIIAIIVVFVR